jgi:hypothetical protein
MSEVTVALTGLDIEEKAALVEAAFWEASGRTPDEFAEVTTRVVRSDKVDPATNEEATAQWRLTLKDPDESKLGRSIATAVTEIALATIPGMYVLSAGRSGPSAFGVYRAALVDSDLVPQSRGRRGDDDGRRLRGPPDPH